MSKISLSGDASGTGTFTIASPNSNSNFTLTIPQATTTIVGTDATQTLTNKTLGSGLVMEASAITSGTAQATTSGTSIDFTGIPSWVKRVTVMFNGVSTNGTSAMLVQLGDSGGVETTGYLSMSGARDIAGGVLGASAITTGFVTQYIGAATSIFNGKFTLNNLSGNAWVGDGVGNNNTATAYVYFYSGSKTLSDTLDRVRITTVNGTDTFDAGSINILYE